MSRHLKPILFFALLFIAFNGFVSCTKSSDDEGSSSNDPMDSNSQREFLTDCGTVVNGTLENPAPESGGFLVDVTAVQGNNLVTVERSTGPQLVKILGLADSIQEFQQAQALEVLSGLLGAAVLYEGEGDCTTNILGRGTALVASLFSRRNGASFSESLLKAGAAEVDPSGLCNAGLVTPCYAALADMNRPQLGAEVSNFLWKPVSERDGNLVVLLNPGRARIFANDEELVDFGPSNGRGTTARSNRPGCAFGSDVVVRAFDSRGRILVFPGNQTEFIIPDGCSRVEF